MDPITLFDSQSANLDSVTFEIKGQRTVIGMGLQPDDYITFEVVKVSAGAMPKICGCRLSAIEPSVILGVQELQCPGCSDTTQRPVTLTPQNPIIVLDAPQGSLVRAVYHGTGIDLRTVTVWTTVTNTPDLTDAMRGCAPEFFTEEEFVWHDTGKVRCLPDEVTVEVEQVNQCGEYRWFPSPTLTQNWQPTNNLRCLADQTTVEAEEINRCGDRRWVESLDLDQNWQDTGNLRCLSDDATVEAEQINRCGDRRWVVSVLDQNWQPTGNLRCLPDDTTVEIEEINRCGDRRWVEDEEEGQNWQLTGNTRCLDDQETLEVEQVNRCGERRWVESDTNQVWVETGKFRCVTDELFDDDTDLPLDIDVEEQNDCGQTRWVRSASRQQSWQPSGIHRCLPDGVEIQYVNDCGDKAWVRCGDVAWTDTGKFRCVDDGDNYDDNGLPLGLEVEQTNQCGHRRWTLSDSLTQNWQPTGIHRCTDEGVEIQYANQCGEKAWAVCGDVAWIDTGKVRCIYTGEGDGTVEVEQTNQCGHRRWVESEVIGPNWQATGQQRCNGGLVDTQEVNRCGDLRWRLTATPCSDTPEDSVHEILSITPLSLNITEGDSAIWDVVLNGPVGNSSLGISFALSGDEQAIHNYPAPSLVIPVGASSGMVIVPTLDDTTDEPTRQLVLTALTSARVTAVPPGSAINVLDNDEPAGGDSTHTVLTVVPDPLSADEGTTFDWTVTLDAPVAGSDLLIVGVLSGDEQTVHGYANPTVVIPIGSSSGVLSVTTNDDFISEATRQLCLTVQTGPRITAVPAAACVDVLDNEATPEAIIPATIGNGNCYVDDPVPTQSEFYVIISPAGAFATKNGNGFPDTVTTWLPSGADPNDYEVRVDDTSGVQLLRIGPTRGVWHNLGTVRDFRWRAVSPAPKAGYLGGSLKVRRVGETGDGVVSPIDPNTFVSIGVECP